MSTDIILLTELGLNVLSEDGDVLVSVSPHLRVHDPEQVEHLVQQPPPVLPPALSLVCQLVSTVQDHLLILRRLSIHCSTEPGSTLLYTGGAAVNLVNQSYISIVLCQPIRYKYCTKSTNRKQVFT